MTSANPIFVVGVFRSGTSLLCSLLNQNPKISLMFECDVWNFPASLLKFRFRRNWAERMEFYNQSLSRHRIISTDDLSALANIRTPLNLYDCLAQSKGAVVSGEKSPFYCDRLNQLYKQYPNAYFIIISRPAGEIYRSVLKAGQSSRFFGRPGMLSRMIYHQEQIILQSDKIEKSGARVFRLDYAGLVDRTEKICREMSDFLGVPFDPQMLQLNRADLSAVFKGPNFAHLRRGIIERQQYTEELVPPAIATKLQRYQRRWSRMQATRPDFPAGAPQPEPGFLEVAYHNLAGWALTQYDSLVRAAFEFLPLSWLYVYRLLKNWVINPPSGSQDVNTSIVKDCQKHWSTILTATVMLALIAWIHSHSNPHLMFVLIYSLPCMMLALVVNTRWATLFVLLGSALMPIIQYEGDTDYRPGFVIAWNVFSRFILMEALVLTLARIRMDFKHMEIHGKIASGEMPDGSTPRSLKFSIITPSFRNSNWLKLCIASVADQKGVELEHIVQDSCSDDGTQDWLPHDTRVKAFIEKDKGMYDAVNRGYRRATGDILAYLNCDEQYLPGGLAAVEDFFQEHHEVEVLLAGTIVTDGHGDYVCHRHSMVPNPRHIWYRFPALTSSIFIRRRVIAERGIFFDTRWRDLGDFHWVLELMKNKVPMAVSNSFTSAFADTGENMNLKPNAVREKIETQRMAPGWLRTLKPVWIGHHRLRRLAAGHFSLKPTSYSIYTLKSPEQRVKFDVPKPTAVWWNRL